MASASVSASAAAKAAKPSFAKIAAAGLKPPTPSHNQLRTDVEQKNDINPSPRDGTHVVASSSPSSPSTPAAFTPKQQKILPAIPKETNGNGTGGPLVQVQVADASKPPGKATRALDGMLMPASSDEAGTQVSSPSGSIKPPSVDGKSVASGATFGLDEKESLRPDDSASTKATEDEDVLSPHGSGIPGSHAGSDDGVRAFRDQLREISSMEPERRPGPSDFGASRDQPRGLLYIPPQGPGVGALPGAAPHISDANTGVDFPPDSKLLEALDSPKDRIMVLKLEQDIVDFVKDAKESTLKLPQTNAFYRMLAHRLADYYMLGHVVDESTQAVRIFKAPNCRLPPPLTGIATPSTAASTPPPSGQQMTILRRGLDSVGSTIAHNSHSTSKTTSENGESGNDDERRPKALATREEREARYEAARKRIMGSAKPLESPEEPVETENSRSSSAAGKKSNKKKLRSDSDDDFEARSAYSAYYPASYNSDAATPTYGFSNNFATSTGGQFSQGAFGNQGMHGGYSSYNAQANSAWPDQMYSGASAPQGWAHQQPGHDLANDFQRAMSFQHSPMSMQAHNPQSNINAPYGTQFYNSQQTWPHANFRPPSQPLQPNFGPTQGFPNRPGSSSSQSHDGQPYAFGQLPSQAYPGRPPNKLEHPLPGSYKSKHFNPQSQSFVPGQVDALNTAPTAPPTMPASSSSYGGGYSVPTPPRQNSTHSQGSQFSSTHPATHTPGGPRTSNQPMTHPLPQPVFPRQPSPNVPLPAKPEISPHTPASQRSTEANGAMYGTTSATNPPSSIAKWGTPASLPAKPPPSAELSDAAKFTPTQRLAPLPTHNITPRPAVNGMTQNFAPLPTIVGSVGVSSGPHSPRRT